MQQQAQLCLSFSVSPLSSYTTPVPRGKSPLFLFPFTFSPPTPQKKHSPELCCMVSFSRALVFVNYNNHARVFLDKSQGRFVVWWDFVVFLDGDCLVTSSSEPDSRDAVILVDIICFDVFTGTSAVCPGFQT